MGVEEGGAGWYPSLYCQQIIYTNRGSKVFPCAMLYITFQCANYIVKVCNGLKEFSHIWDFH